MELEYIFYETDDSFDYGDCGRTCYRFTKHGFTIDVNSENGLDIKTLKGFGDYHDIQGFCGQDFNLLKGIIVTDFDYIQDEEQKQKFNELIEMIEIEEMR